MPSGSYRQADVVCPFYKYDDGWRRITCEGVMDDTSLAMIFHRREDYNIQMTVFCCAHYPNCELYRMLMENKYEEEM